MNEQEDPPQLPPEPPSLSLAEQTVIIIGNGMMSFRLCQKLVEYGATGQLEIVVFGEEPRPAYDRVHLTELFSGKTAEDLTFAPADWYADHGIALYLGDPIVEINTDDCIVRSASGLRVPYDRLVFATGSRPFVPPIPGVDLPGVFVYRTVEHLAAIMDYRRDIKRAAVIGGGLLGLEAAKAAFDLGLAVDVVEFAPGLMPRQLDAAGAALLKEKIEALGVRVHLNKQTLKIVDGPPADATTDKGERILHFANGGKLAVDMVVISAGIRPRGELAGAAGLELAKNGGIIVDDHLTTSDPRIFAVGECAVHRGTTFGLIFPGYKMVDNLVDNLLGGAAKFEGADMSSKLKLMGVAVASLGQHDEKEQANTTVNSFLAHGMYRKVVMRDGRIIGALSVGEWENLDRVREAIDQPRVVSFWDMRRFRSTGNLWLKSESPPVAEWPADALVCGCMRVSRGTLTLAQLDGCGTVEELCARTSAGTMCGSCKPLLAELLHGNRDSMPPSRHDSIPAPPTKRGRDMAPASVRSRDFAPPSVRNPDLGPASVRSMRRSLAPPRPAVSIEIVTPAPAAVAMMQAPRQEIVSTPTPTTTASIPAPPPSDAEAEALYAEEWGPRSIRGASLPPTAKRRSTRNSVRAPAPVEESSATKPDRDSAPISVSMFSRSSFRPPEVISFLPWDGDAAEAAGPISPRVAPTSAAIQARFPLAAALDDEAHPARRSILPPESGPSDPVPPAPDSSSPQSLRDLFALSVLGSPALRSRESPGLLREMAGLLEEEPRSRESSREFHSLKDRHPAPRDEAGQSEAPPSMLGDAAPISRRRDSLPPLRALSIPPGRLSAGPESIAPPQRASLSPVKAVGERRHQLLLAVAIGSLLFVTGIATLPSIPPAHTVQGWHLEQLWTSNVGKQVTGYAIVALGLASLLLSLRMRWKRFSYSDVPSFRVLHGGLATLALIALVLHTGLHLGENFNRVLMLDFLTLTLLGSAAAGITAVSHRWSPIAARNRRSWGSTAHIALVWPLPVLVAIHIIGAYYY